MPKRPRDPAASAEALKFFEWAYDEGDDMVLKLNYVPMPDKVVRMIEASWKQIRP